MSDLEIVFEMFLDRLLYISTGDPEVRARARESLIKILSDPSNQAILLTSKSFHVRDGAKKLMEHFDGRI